MNIPNLQHAVVSSVGKYDHVIVTCPFDGATNVVIVDADAMSSYMVGESYVQDLTKDGERLSAGDAELIKTGICQTCWDEIFATAVDNDEDED